MPSESDIIKITSTPITYDRLRKDLQKLGVCSGDTLFVHSSLSAIGWVCGGQVAVCNALLDAVGKNGTVVMPAHTPGNSDPAEWEAPPVPAAWHAAIRETMPPFDRDKSPSEGVGAIAECFRHYPGALRSAHPQTSFCACGRDAAYITADHALTPQFGDDSPIGKGLQMDAKVLLLGVGYNRCSALHYAETKLSKQSVKMGASVSENGVALWKWFYDTDFDADRFPSIGVAFEAQTGSVKIGFVGQAECRLFSMRQAIDFALHCPELL